MRTLAGWRLRKRPRSRAADRSEYRQAAGAVGQGLMLDCRALLASGTAYKGDVVSKMSGPRQIRLRAGPGPVALDRSVPQTQRVNPGPQRGLAHAIAPGHEISWNWVNTFRRHGPLRNGLLPLLCATIAVSRSRMCFSRRGQVGAQPPSRSRRTRRERLQRISPSCRSC